MSPRGWVGMGFFSLRRLGLVILIVSSSLAFSIPFLYERPPSRYTYSLVAGESGSLYAFDGRELHKIAVPTGENLTVVRWRNDGAYALVAGTGGTLLKYDGLSVEAISTGVEPAVAFRAISWKPDDSEALIAGSKGVIVRFDGRAATQIARNSSLLIRSIEWSPSGGYALVAGYSSKDLPHGFIARLERNTLTAIPSSANFTMNVVAWDSAGNYALIGGSTDGSTTNATLFRYDGGSLTQLDTARCCFINAAHSLFGISINKATGAALITGGTGLVIIGREGNMTRIRPYVDLSGRRLDTHRIVSFYAGNWVPGEEVAYAVGTNGTIARISNIEITLVRQGTPSVSFTSISIVMRDWEWRTRSSIPTLATEATVPERNPLVQSIYGMLKYISSHRPALLIAILAIVIIVIFDGFRPYARGKFRQSR